MCLGNLGVGKLNDLPSLGMLCHYSNTGIPQGAYSVA